MEEQKVIKQVKKRKPKKTKQQEGGGAMNSKMKKPKKVKQVKMKKPKRVKHQGKGRKDPDPKFKVPKKLYERVFDEIKNSPPKKSSENIVLLCHSNPKENFCVKTKNGLNKSANFLKAAKEALEMRDFKSLYRVCIKGFEINDKLLNKVLYEYLYLAIENDPLIPSHERHMYLMEAVQGCKIMYVQKGSAPYEFESETQVSKHIEQSHLLIQRNNVDNDDEESSEESPVKIEKFDPVYEQ